MLLHQSQTTTRQYNTTLGCQTEEKTVYNSSGTIYKKVEYLNQIKAGGVYRPQNIISTQKHEDDSSVFQQARSLTYDTSKGYVTREVQNGLTTDYVYDTYGNRTSNTVSGSGITTLKESCEYDTTGRFVVKRTTVPASTIMTYTYDRWGNVKTSTDPVSSVSYVYSSVGKPSSTTGAGATFSMTYDSQGRQTTLTDPDAGTETYEYGVLDRIIKQMDAKGKVTTKR